MSTERFTFALEGSEMPLQTFGLNPPKVIAYIGKKLPLNFSVKRSFRTILKGVRG